MNSQISLYDQLMKLKKIANDEGLYDAADYLTAQIEKSESLDQSTPVDPQTQPKPKRYLIKEGKKL